jgi:tetratricopeptide (TPR) repeat protein
VLLCAAGAAPAQEEGKEQQEKRKDSSAEASDPYKKGSAAFDLGQFDEAIKYFEAAYKLKTQPALLYNLGQAHRMAGHLEKALRFYQTYLAKAPNPPNRAAVEAHIAQLKEALSEQKRAAEEERKAIAQPPTHSVPEGEPSPGAPPSPGGAARVAPSPAAPLTAAPRMRGPMSVGLQVGAVSDPAAKTVGISVEVALDLARGDWSVLGGTVISPHPGGRLALYKRAYESPNGAFSLAIGPRALLAPYLGSMVAGGGAGLLGRLGFTDWLDGVGGFAVEAYQTPLGVQVAPLLQIGARAHF